VSIATVTEPEHMSVSIFLFFLQHCLMDCSNPRGMSESGLSSVGYEGFTIAIYKNCINPDNDDGSEYGIQYRTARHRPYSCTVLMGR
jgi:hypothetical protein